MTYKQSKTSFCNKVFDKKTGAVKFCKKTYLFDKNEQKIIIYIISTLERQKNVLNSDLAKL